MSEIRKLFNAVEKAIFDLGDALDGDHDCDCPYTFNHKGAIEWIDGCRCRIGSLLREALYAIDELGQDDPAPPLFDDVKFPDIRPPHKQHPRDDG